MAKRWMAMALAALGWAGTATAQMPTMPPGQPPMTPNFAADPSVPPMGQFCAPGSARPKEAESPFALPNDGSPNAFSDDCPCGSQQTGVMFNIGSLGLLRQKLSATTVSVIDPQTIDTGIQPPPGQQILMRFNSVPVEMQFGVKATIGYREAGYAVELTGFYLPWNKRTVAVSLPGQIDLPFDSFNSTPIGFQGDNFLWTQADRVTQYFQNQMSNVEANFRFGNGSTFEWIFGVRAMQIQERYGILTEDDSLVVQPTNPTQVALYQVQTNNRMVLGQFGFEWELPLLSRFAVGGYGKAGFGVNWINVNHVLVRGDGFVGFDENHNRTTLAQVYDVGLFADWLITDQWRLRVGYQALAAISVGEAAQNVDFNLATQGLNNNYSGSVFYHGPLVEFQFVF